MACAHLFHLCKGRQVSRWGVCMPGKLELQESTQKGLGLWATGADSALGFVFSITRNFLNWSMDQEEGRDTAQRGKLDVRIKPCVGFQDPDISFQKVRQVVSRYQVSETTYTVRKMMR